jgi:hypothetical protein
MTIIASVGAYAGLALLVLMALAPFLVELDERFPVARRETIRPKSTAGLLVPAS